MNVRELQIADWVRLVADGDNEILQVTYVREDGVGFKKYAVYFDEIEPIPLTTEMLEKNGFKYDDYENCWKLIEKEGRYSLYSIYVNTNRISIYNWRNEEGECFTDACNKVNVHYKYVHELQRALRCCGLWDLADNFKII